MFDIFHFSFLRLINCNWLLKNRCRLSDRWYQWWIISSPAKKRKGCQFTEDNCHRKLGPLISQTVFIRVRISPVLRTFKNLRILQLHARSNKVSLENNFTQLTRNNNPSPWMSTDFGSFSMVLLAHANWSATPKGISSSPRTYSSWKMFVFTAHVRKNIIL